MVECDGEDCTRRLKVGDSDTQQEAEQSLIEHRNWSRQNGGIYCTCCYRDGKPGNRNLY